MVQVSYIETSDNLYNPHAGADMNFSCAVGLQVLWVAERGLSEKISFDCFLTAGLNVVLAAVGFETNALGEQK